MKNFMKWLVLNSAQWAVILAGTMSGQQGWYNVMAVALVLVTFRILLVAGSQEAGKLFREGIRGQLLSPYYIAANAIVDWGKFWILAWFGHWFLAILVVIEISCNQWQRHIAKQESEQGG